MRCYPVTADYFCDEPYESAARAETRREILDMINELRPDEARIVKLRHTDSNSEPYTFCEIAESLNMNCSTVKSIYYRACKKMRKNRLWKNVMYND